MNYTKIKDLKDKLNSEKSKKIQAIIKCFVDVADLGLSLYNIIKVHQSFTKCERYNVYEFDGTYDQQCNQKNNNCIYYSEYPLNLYKFNQFNCWISHSMEHLQNDSYSQNYFFGWTIAAMVIVTFIKIAQFFVISKKAKRVRLIFLFYQITITFSCTFFIFQSSAVDCTGTCAVMSDVDKQNLDIGTAIAYVPYIFTVCLFAFYIYMRCCKGIKHPNQLNKSQLKFMTGTMCISIVLFIISNGILLSTFHSFIGISFTLKFQLAFLFIYGLYGLYSIYKQKSKKSQDQEQKQPSDRKDEENNEKQNTQQRTDISLIQQQN